MTSPSHSEPATEYAGLRRRLCALVYEALLLIAVLFAAALPVVMLTHNWEHWIARLFLQAALLAICGAYFIYQWITSGQTLPMKTWRLQLATVNGERLRFADALRRYLLALAGTALFGIGFWWALIDRDQQFLHDRLAGTRIIPKISTAAPQE